MTSYRLWPSFVPGTNPAADTVAYTFGVQFSSSAVAQLAAVWFYSPTGVSILPQTIALFAVGVGTPVHSEAASWSGAAGSGWVRAAFASPPVLTAGSAYKACVYSPGGGDWYTGWNGYWVSGAGASGISNGPLSAPADSGASPGQDSYVSTTPLAYPGSSFQGTNYWVDPEISAAAVLQGTAALAASPALTASATTAHPAHAAAATLGAQALLVATALPGPDLNALWAAYQAAALKASKARDAWHMMRQAGGTDGTAGFLYQAAYIAEHAEEAAYEAFLAAQRIVFPGARG